MGISKTIKEKVLEKGKGKCSSCGRRNVPLDIDHIAPINKTSQTPSKAHYLVHIRLKHGVMRDDKHLLQGEG